MVIPSQQHPPRHLVVLRDCPLSVSPTISELELQTFGHRIAPLPFPFDPRVDPPSPSLSLPPLRDNFSRVHSFELPNLLSGDLSNQPLASDISPISTSPRLSVFPAGPKLKGSRTAPAPASTRLTSPDADIPDAKEFEIMVWTYGAPKKSTRKSKKVAKVEPISHGPITANTDMTWDYMVNTIAKLLGTSPEFLVISSMEWRWLKPQNSPWLPLRNESGFASLIRQLLLPPKAVSGASSPSTPAAPPAPSAPPPPLTPTTAVPPTLYPNPYPYGPLPFPPSMGYPSFPSFPIPGLYGHSSPLHMLPWQDTPRARRRHRSFDGSSPPQQSSSKRRREERLPDPPSSPGFSGGSLDDFPSRYPDLPAPTRPFLDELGFEIGDDLLLVTEAQWKDGGLTLFG
ncbi:hypothetical protein K438DRAFT_1973860 [Mycena galopus ATCC 62051]|nr:hypothetical protein K438DRAFT_1973860 [Mycena galopus ATCC 62051]